jgi:hypothetical protein
MNSPVLRAVLHLLASVFGGGVLGFVGGLAGSAIGAGSQNGFGDLIGAILLSMAGFVIGSALGATLAGPRLGRSAPWWFSLLAAVGAAILVMVLAEPLRLNTSTTLLQITFVVATAAAAVFIPPLLLRRK